MLFIKIKNQFSMLSKKGMFPIKKRQGKELKKSTSQEMLQRLPTALVQIKTGNTCENLLNEIRQIIYSLHQAREKSI